MLEREVLEAGRRGVTYYRDALDAAAEAGRLRESGNLQSVISAENQEWEDSPHGLLKHMVNARMGTSEPALDMYQHVIEAGGHSGKHRHFSEELLFVVEGSGYDLHWDPVFAPDVKYAWSWSEEPKTVRWAAGDFVRIPPYATHQHFADATGRARLISATLRITKDLGYDGLEQVSNASSYRAPQ